MEVVEAEIEFEGVSFDTALAISEFINSLVGGPSGDRCPVCGNTNSKVLGLVHNIPISTSGKGGALTVYTPSYVTSCQTCGYMRLFSKAIVDAAIKSVGGGHNG